ncbi:MAG: HlyD family type I secretion periplasmic adaptor subunit [Ferrovibrio sp.]|jgi:adhesin transport system membrane fusion protein
MSEKLPAMHADPSRIRYLTLALQLEEGQPPRLMQFTVWLVAAIIACAVGWAAVTKVAQVARAPGEIIPNGHTQPIQHLEGGIVREAAVREGDLVEAGQVLVRLDHTGVMAELEQVRTRESSLRLQAERLRAFAEGRIAALEDAAEQSLSADQAAILRSQEKARLSQRAVLERQLAGRRADLEALLSQQKTLQRQIVITGEALEMRKTLTQQGLNSKLTFLDVQREMNRVQGELSTVTVNIGRAREAIAEAEQRLIELESRLSADAMRELGAVTSDLRQIEELRVKLEDRVARTEIVSPVRGIIKDLRAYAAGAVIQPGGFVAEVVPVGRELIVEARVSPSDIGQLRPGQPVAVKVSTYDFAQFGSVPGQLVHVSPSTFHGPNIAPFYKALVRLERGYAGEDPARNPLLPGMTVLADIKTDERTVLRFLLNPVYRAIDTAFQER